MSQHIGHLPGVSGNIPMYQVASERKKKKVIIILSGTHMQLRPNVSDMGAATKMPHPCFLGPRLILTLYIMMKIDNLRRKWKMTSKMQLTKQNSFYFV